MKSLWPTRKGNVLLSAIRLYSLKIIFNSKSLKKEWCEFLSRNAMHFLPVARYMKVHLVFILFYSYVTVLGLGILPEALVEYQVPQVALENILKNANGIWLQKMN